MVIGTELWFSSSLIEVRAEIKGEWKLDSME